MNMAPRFGIEEEYFLTDLTTRQLLAQPDADLLRDCREAVGPGFAYEMFQGQIEVASPVFSATEESAEFLGGVRSRLNHTLALHDSGLLCAGTHPLAHWRDQRATALPHFEQLFAEYQSVAQRSVLCGLHVHVEIPPGIDRIAVMNEVAPWLPLLLLLSCSSPFWEGAQSGFMSYRQVVCDGWPRMGVPEYFANEDEYQRYLTVLRDVGVIEKDGNGWWGLRPASRYPTLELRMTDACPRLADTLLLASLFRVITAFAIARENPGVGYDATTRWLLAENRWQAKRHGLQGRFVTDTRDGVISAAQWIDQARALLTPTAQRIGEAQVFDQAEALLLDGNSACRQLACHARAMAKGADPQQCLYQVVDHLLQESRG
ncbi:Carboxylate-amine ligase YbdK [compost metagenome]